MVSIVTPSLLLYDHLERIIGRKPSSRLLYREAHILIGHLAVHMILYIAPPNRQRWFRRLTDYHSKSK